MASFVPLLFFLLESPSWLVPPAGVNPQRQQMEGLSTLTYLVTGKPEAAVEHFRPIFAERKLPFQPGADGIGVTVRAAAPECDLLMQFHPTGGEATRVTVHCAERRACAGQPVVEARPAGRRRLSERPMTDFDQPLHQSQAPFYRDDAPPLQWPAWFTALGTRLKVRPEPHNTNGDHCLVYRYETQQPMTALQAGYRQLFESYGFRVGREGISTGMTLSGHMQNANADVEAAQSVDGKVGSARTIVRASMRRFELNAPIKTTLTVCVKGSFGN
ncbi:MAG: hypothetical protein NW208_12385 [Bryobacter sp.]|nr:hypothetical protein [Bryobacter sp.]